MKNSDNIIVKSRRNYFMILWIGGIFIVFFTVLAGNIYVKPLPFLIIGLMLYFHRVADFYHDRVIINYPFRKKKITVLYKELKRVRYRPAVFNNPPAFVVWFANNNKITKYGFDIDSKDAPSMLELVKSNSPDTVILDPWDDKPINNI